MVLKMNKKISEANIKYMEMKQQLKQKSQQKSNERQIIVFAIKTEEERQMHSQVEEAVSKKTSRFSHALIFRSTTDDNIVQQYLSIHVKQNGIGLTKNYFSKQDYLGYKALKSLPLSFTQIGQVMLKKLYEMNGSLTLDCGDMQNFQEFLAFAKVQTKSEEIKSQSSRSSSQSQRRISDQYKELVRSQQVSTVEDMYRMYQDDSEMCDQIVKNHKLLFTYQGYEQKLQSKTEPQQTKFQSLYSFLQRFDTQSQNFIRLDQSQLMKMLYFDVVDKLYRVIFRKCPDKVNVIWFFGEPNTGKTTLAKHIRKIFITEDFRILNRSFCMDSSTSQQQPQLVVIDEIKRDIFYDIDKIDDLKRFFEGEGFPVNLKQKAPVVRFQKCQKLAISNQFPFSQMSSLDKKSFETRMLTAEFTEEMMREDEKFPFGEVELALYFRQRLINDGDAELMLDEETVIDSTQVGANDIQPKKKK
ncbi:hypothetical protein OXYTRIMIC_747 [Oxytricha trifallax]|uniref:Parvovirus non-structural protein 1 helicase domain-containing protein n=1 Tax=Oxytricha trifallax TaxID=1172189 RepID=A0A073I0Y4_9SPIT|nr:hypothetical protein OXYTRIMIC_747 [Oxytricha trifallax]